MAAQALDLLLQQARPEIRAMHPYEPGKPVETLERELGIREAIKLASNENPRGPGAIVREALAREAADLSRYPDGSAHAFREKLAAQQGLHPDQILLGNGSNDVLELIARVFLAPGRKGVIDQYAFVVYPLAIAGAGGTVCAVPSKAYGHDLPAMAAAVDDSTQLVFIANPNNPTGTVASLTEIEGLLQAVPSKVLVVVDEAYCEYQHRSASGTALSLLPRYPNLVVTRTFSKIYGLAALRLGYAAAAPEIVSLLNRLRQPFNVNSLALAGGLAALDDHDYVEESRRLNAEGLQTLERAMAGRAIPFIPSAGNFLTVEVGAAKAYYDALLQEGVIVRPVAGYGLTQHLRVSVGMPEEMTRFLASFDRVHAQLAA